MLALSSLNIKVPLASKCWIGGYVLKKMDSLVRPDKIVKLKKDYI